MVLSPFWFKMGLCALECDRQNLMEAIGATFGGLLGTEVKGDFISELIYMFVSFFDVGFL